MKSTITVNGDTTLVKLRDKFNDTADAQFEEIRARIKTAKVVFDCEDVTPQAILAPHCEHTRRSCRPGDVS